MSENKKPREWTIKWDKDYQYTDGVPAEIQVATGSEVAENEKVKVVEFSAYQRAIDELKEAADIIHSEFCGSKHHAFCIRITTTLTELGEIPQTESEGV